MNSARLTAARDTMAAHEAAMQALELQSMGKEKKLLKAHEDTLNMVFESVQRDLDAKQVGWLTSQFLKELLSFLCSLAHFHSTLIYCFLLSPLR